RNLDGTQKTDGEANWWLARICRRAGLPVRYWHTLRHCFGTHAALFGVEPVALAVVDGPQAHRGDDALRPGGRDARARAAGRNSRRGAWRGRSGRVDRQDARRAWHICATNRGSPTGTAEVTAA